MLVPAVKNKTYTIHPWYKLVKETLRVQNEKGDVYCSSSTECTTVEVCSVMCMMMVKLVLMICMLKDVHGKLRQWPQIQFVIILCLCRVG